MATTKIPAEFLSTNAIAGTLIADNAITTVHIAQNAITSVQIPNNSIGTVQIALNTVTGVHIAQNSVTTVQLATNSVNTLNIADDQVTADKLASGAVVTASIVDLNVTEGKIAANSITASKIPDGSITATQLGANSVTLAKMASLTRGSILVGDSAADVAALAIGTSGYVLKSDGTDAAWAAEQAIAANSVTSGMIASNSILTRHIDDDQVTGDQLADNITLAGTLSVAGNLTQTTGDYLYTGGGNFDIKHNSASQNIVISTTPSGGSATSRMRITHDGMIGIGTDSPSRELHVHDASSDNVYFMLSNNTSGIGTGDGFQLFTDGTNAGVLLRENGYLKFTTNNTDRIKIDASGNVGIGTSSPVAPLTINDKATFSFNSSDFALGHQLYYDGGDDRWERLTGNAGSAIYQTAGNVLFYRTAAGGSTGDAVTPTESMRIGSGGGVGIGTTTTAVPLTINLASDINWRFLSASSQSRMMAISDNGGTYKDIGILGSNTIFYQQGSERARIDSSGSLGLGTNNPGSLFHAAHSNGGTNPTARIENTTGTVAANSILLDLKFSGDDSFSNCDYIRFQDSSGEEGVITGDGGSRVYYEINSDYRLKENITSYSGGLNIINALSVKKYNYIKSPGTNYTGFLAHEVAEVVDGVARGVKDATEVLSNVVLNHNSVVIDQGVTETEWTDGKTSEKYASNTTWSASHTRNINQGLDLSKLVPDLVSAIQEQQTIIDDLKSRIETLEG